MEKKLYRYSAELDVVDGSFPDRYMGCGYGPSYDIPQFFERLGQVDRVTGVELVSNWHISEKNAAEIRRMSKEQGLQVVSILPDHFSEQKWGKGAFTSTDKNIRREAVDLVKRMIDIAADLDCHMITIWNGQDGYDYLMTADYIREMEWLLEGLKECCEYRPDVKIAVEYKVREPRLHCYLSNVYATLAMIQKLGCPNMGVTLDVGHAYIAHENPAEAVAACKLYGDRLFHVHVNDNFGVWDDDCMVGANHILEAIELMYWIKRTGYDGWFSFDQYTPRLDGRDALIEGAKWLDAIADMVAGIDDQTMDELFKKTDAIETSKLIRQLLFK